jgi:putative transposase
MLLRQQLLVLKRQVKRPALTWRDRALFVLLASKLPTWKEALVIVQPETVQRWHRELFRWVWRRKSRSRKRGKPPLTDDIIGQDRLRDMRYTFWAWMAVMATVLMMSSMVQPRLRSLTGFFSPWSTGPMAMAPVSR